MFAERSKAFFLHCVNDYGVYFVGGLVACTGRGEFVFAVFVGEGFCHLASACVLDAYEKNFFHGYTQKKR